MTVQPVPSRDPGAIAPIDAGAALPSLRLMPSSRSPDSIGIVLHDFALGGTERIAVRLANRWAADGAIVTLFAGARDGPLLDLLDSRVRLASPADPIRRSSGSMKRLAVAAARYFGQYPVRTCFVPGNYHWPVAWALGQLPNSVRPAVAVQVSAALHKPQRGPLRQIAYNQRMRRLLRKSDVVVSLCAQAGQEADRILRRQASIPLPLPALDDRPGSYELTGAQGRMILAAGRLVREKGFDVLIEAFSQLVRTGQATDATLVIVGEGPDRKRLSKLIQRNGLHGHVSMPGYAKDIGPWLDRARLFVLPSRFEGYGAVIVEALAAGRPVIATRCTPAVDDLLRDTGAGLDVPIEDSAALANAIAQMLDAPAPDPARLASLVQHHRIGAVAREYARLFRRIAERRPTPSA